MSTHFSGQVLLFSVIKESTMASKKLITVGMIVGSMIGGYIPSLFGIKDLFISLFASGIGAVAGIWIMYKISQ